MEGKGEKASLAKEAPAIHVRKSVLSVLALVAALGGAAWMAKGRQVGDSPGIAKGDASQKDRISEGMETDWMRGIRLPELGAVERGVADPLLGLPVSGHGQAEEKVRADFLRYSEVLTADLSGKADPLARQESIVAFFGDRFAEARNAQGEPPLARLMMGSADFFGELDRLNGILVPAGRFLTFAFRPDDTLIVGVYRVVEKGGIGLGDRRIPIVWTGLDQAWSSVKDASRPHFNALHLRGPDRIVLDERGAVGELEAGLSEFRMRCDRAGARIREFDPIALRRDFLATAPAHEAGHLWLESVRYDSQSSDGIRRSGDIPMGAYTLPYSVYAKADNAQLHELVAHGVGLAHSGVASTLVAHGLAMDTHQPAYALAREVLWRELTFCPEIDSALRQGVLGHIESQKRIPLDRIDALVSQAPPESLRRIGDRMAKLGVYLAGK